MTSESSDQARVQEALRTFVAIASHELRTPLAAIGGFASTMIHYWDAMSDEQKLRYLGIIETSVERMSRLISNLLAISRIEGGGLDLQQVPVSVVGIIHQTLSELQKEQEVEVDCPEDLTALVDPDTFQQILINYLGNAFKYGAPPFEIAASNTDDGIEIVMRDRGEGVPEGFVVHLFEKFARADTQASRADRGTGLGLSVVRGLARANGGDAWFEPNHPRGARFYVRLKKAG